MSRSIRQRLILSLMAGLSLLFASGAGALYLYTRGELLDRFDAELAKKLRTLASMSERETAAGESRIELEFADFPLPEFQPSPEAEYFQVLDAAGAVLARSASLGEGLLEAVRPSGVELGLEDGILPDGRLGRIGSLVFSPARDPDEASEPRPDNREPDEAIEEDRGTESPSTSRSAGADRLVLVLGRSREGLDDTLSVLALGFLAAGVFLIAGATLIVRFTVSRGLAPLDRIARSAASIGPRGMDRRFESRGLPTELAPIVQGLNDLMSRLEAAFERERRFSADVAHELRTPLAELRTLAEVELGRGAPSGSPAIEEGPFSDVLDIAGQMERLVTTLLALVRGEMNRIEPIREPVDLADLLKRLVIPHRNRAESRNIAIESDLPAECVIRSDPDLITAIINNLLANAVKHGTEGGRIRCALTPRKGGFRLAIRNTCEGLSPDDLPHLFEPFWMKDPSRTAEENHGLGLPLAGAFARILGFELHADLPAEGEIELVLEMGES